MAVTVMFGSLFLTLLSMCVHLAESDLRDCIDNNEEISMCLCMLDTSDNSPISQTIDCRFNKNGSKRTAFLNPLHCITLDYQDDIPVLQAGSCPFTGRNSDFEQLSGDIQNLTSIVCGNYSRSGRLCGRCDNDSALALNTYDLRCISKDMCHTYNWVIFYIMEFTGIVLFFLVIVFFNIRATAECASSFILIAQIISLPINVVTIQRDWAVVLDNPNIARGLADVVEAVYGIWSLNIPSGIFYPICVHMTLTPIEAFALKYVEGIFPVMLILIVYILIKLYEKNVKFVLFVWRFIRKFWLRFRRRINPKTTIIDLFATFLLLSYTKFTYISLIILSPTNVYTYNNVSNENGIIRALLYDGSLDYFEDTHKSIAILALFVLVFIVIPPPFLLLFYQFRWFQKILTCFRLSSHTLAMFVNAFQSGYKDGREGTRDCRFFSGIYFLVRIVVFALFSFVEDYFILFFVLHGIAIFFSFLFIVFQPYKKNLFNKIDTSMTLFFTIITAVAIQNNLNITFVRPSLLFETFFYILIFVPALYMGTYVSIWLSKRIYHLFIKDRLQRQPMEVEEGSHFVVGGGRVIQFIQNTIMNSIETPVSERVPDRLSHPDQYTSGEYGWFPDDYNTENDTTTDNTTTTTNSTYPNSTTNNSTSTATNNTNRNSGRTRLQDRWPFSLRAREKENNKEYLLTQHNTS